MKDKNITINHGNGGKHSQELIEEIFVSKFDNKILNKQGDSAILTDLNSQSNKKLAFSTDSYTVKPIFFSGGNIGKLAVTGTINDLSVAGAIPKYLSVGMILEEGFKIDSLKEIVDSMQETANRAGVRIVTGDTKVVEKGSIDKIFINTSGIGEITNNQIDWGEENISVGDDIIINGTIGDHGSAIIIARDNYPVSSNIKSDCACLNDLIQTILQSVPANKIRIMRDPTRGGVATTLNEFISRNSLSISVDEESLPINDQVRTICEITGFDPLYLANEGKVIILSSPDYSEKIINIMHSHKLGTNSKIIGKVEDDGINKVHLKTITGGTRILDPLITDMLPRIC